MTCKHLLKLHIILSICLIGLAHCVAVSAATTPKLVLCTPDAGKTWQRTNPLDAARYFPTTLASKVPACKVIEPPKPSLPPVTETEPPTVPPVVTVVDLNDGLHGMPFIDQAYVMPHTVGASDFRLRTNLDAPAESPFDNGAFRVSCLPSHMARNDALVKPNQKGAAHLHTFFGNTGTDENSTSALLQTTGNSTCNGGLMNRSAYWVPTMVDTATGRPLTPRNAQMYYKHGVVSPFPKGLVMIAGSAMSSAPQDAVWYECNEKYESRVKSMPVCGKGSLVTMAVIFPDCNNGALDSTDHKAHMAYSSDGKCPATHKVHFPTLTMLTYYPVTTEGTSKWRLSSDMYGSDKVGGLSGHADFMYGWDVTLHNTLVNRCINTAKDCHSHLTGDGREFY